MKNSGIQNQSNYQFKEPFISVNIENLANEDLLLLKKMSLLPSVEIEFSFLKRVIQNVRRGKVNFLVKEGWLIKKGDTYKLPESLKAFILENYQPTLEEMEKPVKFFSNLLKNSYATDSGMVLEEYISYFDSIDIILNRLRFFNETVIEFWNSLGLVYKENGFLNEALPYFVKVIKINEKIFGIKHEATVVSYHNLASLYSLMGEYKKAESVYVKVVALTEELFGKEHVNMLTSLNNLAGVYHSMGEYGRAEPLYLNVIEMSKKMLGEEHLDTKIYMKNLEKLYVLVEKS